VNSALARRRRRFRDEVAPIVAAPAKHGHDWLLPVAGIGLVGGGVLVWMFSGNIANAAAKVAALAGFYADPSSRAAPYWAAITAASQATGAPANLLAGIADRETRFGQTRGWNGTTGPSIMGDNGNAFGMWQVNRTYHPEIVSLQWDDPQVNATEAGKVYMDAYTNLQNNGVSADLLTRAALDAYNAGWPTVLSAIKSGADPDSVTTMGNYGTDVLGRAAKLTTAAA